MDNDASYGMWWLVLVNSLFFILFALSFTRPRGGRDWRSLGAFSAFIVALFAEMYGFPLSIYLLSGWLANHYPDVDPFAHDTGHFWHTLLGSEGPAHSDPLHIFSGADLHRADFTGGILAHSVSGATGARPGRERTLCRDQASSVCRVHHHYAGLSSPVADLSHSAHVPCARGNVYPSCARRGGRGPCAIR